MTMMKFPRLKAELEAIRSLAESGGDRPVTMMNLNRYVPEAEFPNGKLYRAYIDGLEAFLPNVGGKILWRTPVFGRVVGDQVLHEILAAWYPSHQAFLDLPNAQGAQDNYRLRNETVEYAAIHRCVGEGYGLGHQS
ncbi:MAG: hypothetical protein VX430_04025 [Pseudomonadota bacterium]|nr:hypothetical protein [Pseudomonadota bacterium]